MNPTNGKSDKRLHDRTKLNDEEMQERWDKAFSKKDEKETAEEKERRVYPPASEVDPL